MPRPAAADCWRWLSSALGAQWAERRRRVLADRTASGGRRGVRWKLTRVSAGPKSIAPGQRAYTHGELNRPSRRMPELRDNDGTRVQTNASARHAYVRAGAVPLWPTCMWCRQRGRASVLGRAHLHLNTLVAPSLAAQAGTGDSRWVQTGTSRGRRRCRWSAQPMGGMQGVVLLAAGQDLHDAQPGSRARAWRP